MDSRPFPLNDRGVEAEGSGQPSRMVVSQGHHRSPLAYALPALLSGWWRQRRQERIARLNLLLGWTGIGWVVLLGYVVVTRLQAEPRASLALPDPRAGDDGASARSRRDLGRSCDGRTGSAGWIASLAANLPPASGRDDVGCPRERRRRLRWLDPVKWRSRFA